MSLRTIHISSVAELRRIATAWDDLWWRSDVTDPTGRAELLAQWLERFAPARRFHAIIVEKDGKFLAALPLVQQTVRRALRVGHVPSNGWAQGGGLLVTQTPEAEAAVEQLVASLRQLPWNMAWFECVRIESPGFKLLRQMLATLSIAHSVFPQYHVGLIPTASSWADYLAELSKSQRKSLRRNEKRFAALEGSGVTEYRGDSVPEIDAMVRRCFELEDQSWKGDNGSSVIKRGLLPYFQGQARALAAFGELIIYVLEAQDRPIGFQYGFLSKTIFHSFKIGFDTTYARLGPGQLLQYKILERCFADKDCHAFDCLGAISDATNVWRPSPYLVGQLVVAPRGILSRFAVHAHSKWRSSPRVNSVRPSV